MSERRVVLVAGPPCAGKSTYVARYRQRGDSVADFDEVARALGSPGKWMHSRSVGDATEREMIRLVDVAAASVTGAWVIRCAPDPTERADLAAKLRATDVVVLLPGLGTLLARAQERPLVAETTRSIWRWLDRYEPAACDRLIRDGVR